MLIRAGAIACLAVYALSANAQTLPQSLPDYKGQRFELVGGGTSGSSAVSITSSAGFTSLTTVPMYPVFYCGGMGGGTDEYPVVAGAAPVRWLLEVPSPPAGAQMFDVRYEPYDNVGAMTLFAQMLVEKVDDSHVSVTTQAYPNCQGTRVRLRVTVSYAK